MAQHEVRARLDTKVIGSKDLEITVKKYRWFAFSNNLAIGKVENDRFLLGKLNGPFVVVCSRRTGRSRWPPGSRSGTRPRVVSWS